MTALDDDFDDFDDFSSSPYSLFGSPYLNRVSSEDFLNAAASGNEAVVKQYIKENNGCYDHKQMCKRMDVTLDNRSALHHAAKNGHVNIINLLMKTDIDVNARGSMGNSALHDAVSHSQREAVAALLANERVINSPLNDYMESPLKLAVLAGNFGITKMLLEAGVFTSQYDDLIQRVEMEISNFESMAMKCNQNDKAIIEIFRKNSVALRDLLVMHNERLDLRKSLADAGMQCSKDDIKKIHTMSAVEFALMKQDELGPRNTPRM